MYFGEWQINCVVFTDNQIHINFRFVFNFFFRGTILIKVLYLFIVCIFNDAMAIVNNELER